MAVCDQEAFQNILQDKISSEQFEEMIVLLKAKLRDFPQDGELLGKLAGAYIESGQAKAAQQTVEHLRRLYPGFLFNAYLQARVYMMKGDAMRAAASIEAAIQKGDGYASAEVNSLICNLLGRCWSMLGDFEKSGRAYLAASRYAPDLPGRLVDYSNYLFQLNYSPDISREDLYQAHCGYQLLLRDIPRFSHDRRKKDGRKIRIGYISPDFREHVVTYFSYALFLYYDKTRFEVYCFSAGAEDEISAGIREKVDRWESIHGLPEKNAAQKIYAAELDILVDLSGHTRHNCLPVMAYKCAPVQISGIGYFNTTGMDAVDYFLTDVHCDPPGKNDAFFAEKLLRLPRTHFCYTQLRFGLPMPAEPPFLRNGFITFASFNNFTKVNDIVLNVWRRILESLPTAKLILKSHVLGNAYCLPAIKKRLQRLGLPSQRVFFRPETRSYMHEYHDVDIALDTFPYPGGGTTCDAVYMGVPVITLAGERHGARFGCSIMKNLKAEMCIAYSEEEYIEKAVHLAQRPSLLRVLHKGLRTRMEKSPLMDGRQYARDIEQIYQKILSESIADHS